MYCFTTVTWGPLHLALPQRKLHLCCVWIGQQPFMSYYWWCLCLVESGVPNVTWCNIYCNVAWSSPLQCWFCFRVSCLLAAMLLHHCSRVFRFLWVFCHTASTWSWQAGTPLVWAPCWHWLLLHTYVLLCSTFNCVTVAVACNLDIYWSNALTWSIIGQSLLDHIQYLRWTENIPWTSWLIGTVSLVKALMVLKGRTSSERLDGRRIHLSCHASNACDCTKSTCVLHHL